MIDDRLLVGVLPDDSEQVAAWKRERSAAMLEAALRYMPTKEDVAAIVSELEERRGDSDMDDEVKWSHLFRERIAQFAWHYATCFASEWMLHHPPPAPPSTESES